MSGRGKQDGEGSGREARGAGARQNGAGGSRHDCGDFTKLGDLLGDVLVPASADDASATETRRAVPRSLPARNGLERGLARVWEGLVGGDIAANARPLQLRQGRLVVATSSPVWAQTLQFMRGQIQDQLNRSLGEDTVKEIVFRHAGWEAPPRVSPADEGQVPQGAAAGVFRPSAEEAAALAEVEHMCPDERLREQILRAMKAAFAARRGK